MVIVQRTFTRPSTDVAFYTPSDEYGAHFTTAYKETGKVFSSSWTTAADGLSKVSTIMWKDAASLDEYRADPVCMAHFAARNAHNDSVGITSEQTMSMV